MGKRAANALLLSPESVVTDGSDIFPSSRAEHQPPGGRRCGQGVQTRRSSCAQAGEIVVEIAEGMAGPRLSPALMRSTGCAEEKLCPQFPARRSTTAIHSRAVADCGGELHGSARAEAGELLTFDCVF